MNKIGKIFLLHIFIFLFAFIINLLWEYLHTPLYVTTMNHDFFGYMYMAGVDGFLVLLIYWLVCLQSQTFLWFSNIKKHLVLIFVSGIFLSFFIEMKNVYFTSVWSYTSFMPMIPLLHVGLSPVVQMLVTPIFTFLLTKMIFSKLQKDNFL